jgi:hypothetical protein
MKTKKIKENVHKETKNLLGCNKRMDKKQHRQKCCSLVPIVTPTQRSAFVDIIRINFWYCSYGSFHSPLLSVSGRHDVRISNFRCHPLPMIRHSVAQSDQSGRNHFPFQAASHPTPPRPTYIAQITNSSVKLCFSLCLQHSPLTQQILNSCNVSDMPNGVCVCQ